MIRKNMKTNLKEKDEELTDQDIKGCLFLSLGVLSLGFVQFLVLIRLINFTTALILSLIGGFFFYSSLRSFHKYRSNTSEFIIYLKLGFIHLLIGIITLYPLYPSTLLKHIPFGQFVLDDRTQLLDDAIRKEKKTSIRLLMLIGIGDKGWRDSNGNQLFHGTRNPEILNMLLASGLNPNTKNNFGKTMLMYIRDVALAQVLINNGADVNAQDDDGLTALMHAHAYFAPLEYVKFLLLSGADIFITDNLGRSVVDFLPNNPQYTALLQQFSNGKPLPRSIVARKNIGREDWLEPKDPLADLKSDISLYPESIAYGDTADVIIRIVNSENTDRIVNIEARFNSAALFLSASDGGKIAGPFVEPREDQKVVWTMLALPANRTGTLKMKIITREDSKEDLGIHVYAKNNDDRFSSSAFLYFHRYIPLSPSRVETYETATLLFLVAAVLFFLSPIVLVLTLMSKNSSHNMKFAVGRICAGGLCFAIAYVLVTSAMDTIELYTSFQKTEGTILDRRYYTKGSGGSTVRDSGLRAVPVAAVSYVVDSQTIYSTGFAKNNSSLKSLKEFEIGSEVDVWYNPDRPKDFILTRWPDKGYTFLIIIFSTVSIILGRFALMPNNSLIAKFIKQF